MSSGFGKFYNSMGYDLRSNAYGHLQVQGKLHLGNSNKTGFDITYSSAILSVVPYTITDTFQIGSSTTAYATFKVKNAVAVNDFQVDPVNGQVFGAPYLPTTTESSFAANAAITAAGVIGGICLITQGSSASGNALPAATALVTAIPNYRVGTTLWFDLLTVGTGAITLSPGTGGTNIGYPDLILPVNSHGRVGIRITSATTYDFWLIVGGVNT